MFSRNLSALDWEDVRKFPYQVATWNLRRSYPRLVHSHAVSARKHRMCRLFWRVYSVSVQESSSLQSEDHAGSEEEDSEDSPEKILAQRLNSVELKSLLADSERQKLMKPINKTGFSNDRGILYFRHMPQSKAKIAKYNSVVKAMSIQEVHAFMLALVSLAEEIAQSGIPEGSRKINGRFIQSHLHSYLEAVHEKIEEKIKDVGTAQSKEVSFFWRGTAESAQVMGTFDGWSQGAHLLPEYTASFTKFSATLMLRPGRYDSISPPYLRDYI